MTGCNILKKEGTTVNSDSKIVKTTTVTTPETPARPVTDEFLGEWSITEIYGDKVTVNGENHPKLSFQLSEDVPGALMVIGFNGCNYLNGSWIVNGSKLNPNGEFITSLKACPDAPYEFAFNQAINRVASYSVIDNNSISLNSESGTALMTLRKRNLSFLNGAWQVTTIKGTPVPASTAIKVVIDIDECKIHGNAGCNILNGTVVINLDKGDGIEFKDLATTRMTCPDIATEQSFLVALEEVATCTEGASADQAIMKDSDGMPMLTLIRISPDQLNEE